MATQTRSTDLGRSRYHLTARQVEKMIAEGIIPEGDDVELIGGGLYMLVKQEPHNYSVGRIADLLRRLIPDGFHVREEKSIALGKRSLPEPDVVVAPGSPGLYSPAPPAASSLPLIVEVCHHTQRADYQDKLRRYALASVPVYWIVDLHGRSVEVFSQPTADCEYIERGRYAENDLVPVILDGIEVGRVSVAEVLPPLLVP